MISTLEGKYDFAFIYVEKNEYLQYFKLVEDKLQKGTVVFTDKAGIFADQMDDY